MGASPPSSAAPWEVQRREWREGCAETGAKHHLGAESFIPQPLDPALLWDRGGRKRSRTMSCRKRRRWLPLTQSEDLTQQTPTGDEGPTSGSCGPWLPSGSCPGLSWVGWGRGGLSHNAPRPSSSWEMCPRTQHISKNVLRQHPYPPLAMVQVHVMSRMLWGGRKWLLKTPESEAGDAEMRVGALLGSHPGGVFLPSWFFQLSVAHWAAQTPLGNFGKVLFFFICH